MYEIQTGPFARKMVQTLMEIVLTMAGLGHYVIIDDVSFGKSQVDLWKEVLKDYKVLWIGITAPLSVLEARERERSNRIHGSARAKYSQVHKDIVYDLEFNTSKDSLNTMVKRIKEFHDRKR